MTEIIDTFVDEAYYINIAMSMYNLIVYSDNYSDTSGSLWQFKRDEIANNANVTVANSLFLSINQILQIIMNI